MLQQLRAGVGSWVAKIFIGLLVISFGVWGIADVFRPGLSNSAMAVGETKVSVEDYISAYSRSLNAMQRNFGKVLTREQARALGVESQVAAELVSGAALDENARLLNLGLSKDTLARLIGQEKAFQDSSGKFSRDQPRRRAA